MKKLYRQIIDFYHSGNVAFYVSLIGPLVMGTIHLVSVIVLFDWILLTYCAFSYLVVLFKVWQWAIDKYHLKPNNYIAGIISTVIVIIPMMAALMLTIMQKHTTNYFFDWLIYAYALYGTLKMVFAILDLSKKNKTDRQYVLSYLGLIVALYTIQMLEFDLIKMFGTSSNHSMYLIQLITQGFVFLLSIFVIGLFIYKAITKNKKSSADSLKFDK